MASTPLSRPSRFDVQPRLWLLLSSAPIGYVAGSAVLADYGALSGVLAAVVYMTVIGGYAIFGSRTRPWLREHRIVCGTVFGLLSFVTLVGLHIFTPAEDVVVAVAAGVAATALIAES